MADIYAELEAQSLRRPELRAEFLAHMKIVFRDSFKYMNALRRETGFDICADVPAGRGRK